MSKPTTSQTYLFETAFVVAAWALWVVLSGTARADEKLPETQYHIDGAGVLAHATVAASTGHGTEVAGGSEFRAYQWDVANGSVFGPGTGHITELTANIAWGRGTGSQAAFTAASGSAGAGFGLIAGVGEGCHAFIEGVLSAQFRAQTQPKTGTSAIPNSALGNTNIKGGLLCSKKELEIMMALVLTHHFGNPGTGQFEQGEALGWSTRLGYKDRVFAGLDGELAFMTNPKQGVYLVGSHTINVSLRPSKELPVVLGAQATLVNTRGRDDGNSKDATTEFTLSGGAGIGF